ncbi:MAG TPA: beta-ketoacyl-ACP synthase II [Actinomycetota bacterium]|nr:beta-ketoacyl-ACP synthase II [Actinomycetota bacterium]
MTARTVVITGIGPVTPVGRGRQAMWDALTSGRSGIRDITLFDASEFPVKIAGEVRDFDPTEHMDRKEARRTDRVVQLAVAAARMAWEDAGEPKVDPSRTAVVVSTGIGGLTTLVKQTRVLFDRGPDRVSPFMVPSMMPNAAAGQVAMDMGFTGPNTCIVTACAAGAHGVGEAYRYIVDGLADVALAGGTECVINEVAVAGFAQMQALSRNPEAEKASRPFDANRDGFVLSEGACILVLEEEERARARGATIYGRIAGYGASADAFHITQPEPSGSGAVLAMDMALAETGRPAEDVGYINAHGTSTQLNDAAETRAIRKVFGDHADRMAVSSTKSMTGHLLGAAGALEAAATALAVHTGTLPPTINYETPDPDCDLDCVPNQARKADVDLALSNSFGFGGQNAVLAIARP